MRKLILENDNWIIKHDAAKNELNIAYFEDGHFVDDITVPLDIVPLKEEQE